MFHTYDSLPRVPHLPRMMMTWNFIRDDGDVMIINGVYTYIYMGMQVELLMDITI